MRPAVDRLGCVSFSHLAVDEVSGPALHSLRTPLGLRLPAGGGVSVGVGSLESPGTPWLARERMGNSGAVPFLDSVGIIFRLADGGGGGCRWYY